MSMNTDQDPRIERLKEVLASSYPKVSEEADLAPLPDSILKRLRSEEEPQKEKVEALHAKVLRFFTQPMPAFSVAAMVIFCAVLVLKKNPTDLDPDSAIRSGGGIQKTPQLVMLHASTTDLEAFQSSGYFPEKVLVEASSYERGESPAIVVDWQERTVSFFEPGEDAVVEPMREGEVIEQVLSIYEEAFSE